MSDEAAAPLRNPGVHAKATPEKAAYIMADTGQVITYRELNEASNRGAQLFRSLGLGHGDCIAIFMENNAAYLQLCWAAHRAGLYYVCISSYLTAEEVDYIVADAAAQVLITSLAKAEVAAELAGLMPGVRERFMVGGEIDGYRSWEDATAEKAAKPLADETEGSDLLYSSGTTGRPKGIKIPLSGEALGTPTRISELLGKLYQFDNQSIYLSPAPLYHAAPLRYNMGVLRLGGTAIVMERFDPEAALGYLQKFGASHSQWVPTMFVRMLKLPEEVRRRYDTSSMKFAIHAAAPCPVQIKQQMIDWWGPVIYEYYAGTEANGFCSVESAEWLARPGTVGRALVGELHIMDEEDDTNELPVGRDGTIYFADGPEFEYHNDPEKTAAATNARGWTTLGDVGHLDQEGYLYLTDRRAFMIISGGVNIYPQETENLLVTHPRVMDAAVIGVPNEEFGEEVKAVVQPFEPGSGGSELEAELIEFCRQHLSPVKCPRSIDFDPELPRHANGKLYKRLIKDRYWGGQHDTRIV
jgi:acyl-CoA synthetase (AMP-forming)/AMP-acid ligase II